MKKAVKYLVMGLDSKLAYWGPIKYAADKAARITTQLSRLKANVVGYPTAGKSRLLMSVTESTSYTVAKSGPMH